MKIKSLLNNNSAAQYDWILLSDYYMEMAMVLMVILSLTTTNQQNLQNNISKVNEITNTLKDTKEQLYNSLVKEFETDLQKWDATIDKETLSVKFNEPSIQFDTGSHQIKNDFKNILSNFWPRYISTVRKHSDELVKEIRIEGHTSSVWEKNSTKTQSYFGNMELSQNRARSVFEYCYGIPTTDNEWASKFITANGLSYSKAILNEDGTENQKSSQRVEFKVVLDSERKINEIIYQQ